MLITHNNNFFKLDTKNTSYAFNVSKFGYVMHTYYGAKVSDIDLSFTYPFERCRSYISATEEDTEMIFNLTDVPQEYSAFGGNDFRTTALRVKNADGSRLADLRYYSFEIIDGAVKPDNLPSATENGQDNIETLKLVLKDKSSELYVNCYYTVFADCDVITRFSEIVNKTDSEIYVEKAASLQLDLNSDQYDFISLVGGWAKERNAKRVPLHDGMQGFASRRGTTSHQHNTFFSLCDKAATEETGSAFGFHLIYSGNHKTEIEVAQFNNSRVLIGINDEGFSYKLNSGDLFTTPQAAMTFSNSGLGLMSRNFHDFIRNNIYRPFWKDKRRPVLINNWEATYFDFNTEILTNIAKKASEYGIELFVMDDGWFGHRNDDKTSLGDWAPNKLRFPNGLKQLSDNLKNLGMKFGIWIEPEMISEDSDLYREHPDWVLCVPNRSRSIGRNQFIIDLVNPLVKDYVLNVLLDLVENSNVRYIKWDMNRYLTEAYSTVLDTDNEGEAYHRFVLALYDILDKLTTKYPDLLIEHCSGGGGRFDLGMLYYSPQVWTSDNTDPVDRLAIQLGTSLGYPITSMGSHVSASPNHQTFRETPIDLRAAVAYNGTFGYELDIAKLTDEEQRKVKDQVEFYKKHYNLINFGDFYRIGYDDRKYAAWCYSSKDKKEILLFYIQLESAANAGDRFIKIPCSADDIVYTDMENGKIYHGDTLKNLGLCFTVNQGPYQVFIKHLKEKK